jgi:hypothetical protein
MLEWTGAGAGARLKMLVLHDDAAREYAYGPAQGAKRGVLNEWLDVLRHQLCRPF